MARSLGVFSSHPRFAPARLATWYAVALAPLLVAVGVFCYWLSCAPERALALMVDYGRPLVVYGLSALAFAIGFGLTAALTVCLSRGRWFARDERAPSRVVAFIVALLFALGLLAWLLPYAADWSAGTRAFVAWMGLLPLLLLVLLAAVASPSDSTSSRGRPGVRATVIVTTGLVALLLTRIFVVTRPVLESGFGASLTRLIRDATPQADTAIDPTFHGWVVTGLATIVAIPLLAFAIAAVEALVSLRPGRGPAAPTAPAAPPWLADVAGEVDPEKRCGAWNPERFVVSQGAARVGTADPCRDFFPEFRPTVDQAAAFRRITNSGREPGFVLPGENAADGDDVIVEGPRGSGRTAAAVAAILHTVAIRGDSVVLLVPTAAKRRILVQRVREAFATSGLAGFVGIHELTPTETSGWTNAVPSPPRSEGASANGAAGRTATGRRAVPDVLVGTLADFEEQFFSPVHDTDQLRLFLRRVGLLVVDDVDLFNVRDRLHLPSMLAKVRLILGSEGRSPRTVVVTPSLATAAKALVTRQLLAARGDGDHVVRLRLPTTESGEPNAWIVRLTADPSHAWTVESLLEACGRACIQAGLETVVYSPLLSDGDRRSLAHLCSAIDGGRGRAEARFIGDVDEWHALDLDEHRQVATILHSTRDGATVGLAVIGLDATRDAVVFAVEPPGLPAEAPDADHALMVLPGRGSRSLFAQHFASAARFLRRLHPAPRSLWTAMGFPRPGQLLHDVAPDVRGQRLADRVILLDPPESDIQTMALDPGRWPWATMAAAAAPVPQARPARITGNLDTSLVLDASPDGDECRIVIRDDAGDTAGAEQRDVVWLTEDGHEYGRDDLAYAPTLRLRTEIGLIVPSRIERSGRGPLNVFARPWSSSPADGQAYIPVLDVVDLEIPSTLHLKPLHLNAPLCDRVTVLGLVSPAAEGPPPPFAGRRQFAEFHIRALIDASARPRPCEGTIRYEAAKFIVLLDPATDSLPAMTLRDDLLVQWGRGRPATHHLVPELGAALTFAMRRQAPGLERFVRCIGFCIRQPGQPPQHGLLFVEPRSTESSGFALMEPIVCDIDVMAEFFRTAATIADQCRSRPAMLFAHAESCIGAEVQAGHVATDSTQIEEVARLLDAIADAASAMARGPRG